MRAQAHVLIAYVFGYAFAVCSLGACKSRGKAFDDAPPRAAAGAPRGTFALTYYWIPVEDDHDGNASTTIYDGSCATLAKVSASFASALDTAGGGKLDDERMLTVVGACECKRSPCYRAVDAPWGIGAENRQLVPFRSLAVDRDVIPIGTPLWIEQLDGIDLPGTFPTLHDGCVVADDVGGRIKGDKIDWFVGAKPNYDEIHATYKLREVRIFDGGERCAAPP